MLRLLPAMAAMTAIALIAQPAGASEVSHSANLPPALQALEAKMAQLNVNSERYLSVVEGTALIESSRSPGHTHVRLEHVTNQSLGEASLSPAVGEVFGGPDLTEPVLIEVGSTAYEYVSKHAIRVCGRAWVRNEHILGADALFPYHGSSAEANLGGTGSYAGLINLLATVGGGVDTVGQVSVEGQPTTEFTTRVQPQLLVKRMSPLQQRVGREAQQTTLSVFISESGLPVRVVAVSGSGSSQITNTTDVRAVNIPISVKPPPLRETIGAHEYEERSSKTGSSRRCARDRPTSKQ